MTATVDATGPVRVAFWNNPKVRSRAFQVLLVLGVGVLFYEIIANTIDNLKSRNIASGFGFLTQDGGL